MSIKTYKNFAKQMFALFRSTPALLKLAERLPDLLSLAESASSLREIHNNNTKSYPSINSLEAWLETFLVGADTSKQGSVSLDLGCGNSPRNPFGASQVCGVDIREDLASNVMRANLAIEPIPWQSDQFDYCTAFDFLEHVPRVLLSADGLNTRFAFVELMNEIWRVLKPGGLFLHHTPAFPFKQAFQDPTHVNLITEDTIPYYFCEPNLYANRIGYGFNGKFECVGQAWLNTAWIVGVLKAVKD